MKILQVGAKNYPPNHGGTERVVYNIVQAISDFDFYLLVEWEQEENNMVKVIPKNLGYFSRMMFILRFAKENKIDVIHFHNEKYIPMAIFLTLTFKKIVLTIHGVHFRSPKFSFFTKIIFWLVDIIGTILLPRMVHCTEYDSIFFSKFIFFRKTFFVNNGTPICDTIQEEKDIIYLNKYIYLGRITPAKNLLKLIEAANKREIKVDIYGKLDQECTDYCNQFIQAIQNSNFVEYKGEIAYDQVFITMKKYKAFIYITIMEGLPLSVIEAASCGMPLILSNIPHHRYLKLPCVTYVDVKNPIIPYPSEVKDGRDNRLYTIEHFSIEKMGNEYKKIYNSLLN
jgi:glycosyltransferase involved in cell wall biosynthesis